MSHCNYKTANVVRLELRLLCTPLLVALSRAACDKRERECSAFIRQPFLHIHSGILNLAQKHPPKNLAVCLAMFHLIIYYWLNILNWND